MTNTKKKRRKRWKKKKVCSELTVHELDSTEEQVYPSPSPKQADVFVHKQIASAGVGLLTRSRSFRTKEIARPRAGSRYCMEVTSLAKPMKLNSDPFNFELRLADSLGDIDEDFPCI